MDLLWALHTYLHVGDIRETQTSGVGTEYIDSLQNSRLCTQHGLLTLTDTIDRVYTQPEPLITVQDPALARTLTVEIKVITPRCCGILGNKVLNRWPT